MQLARRGKRRIELPLAYYELLVQRAKGHADNLILQLRALTATPDLLLVDDIPNGVRRRLIVSSATFTEYEKCPCAAPNWPIVLPELN